MKMIKNISLTALLSFSLFGAVTFSSCNQDECKDVVCNNGGTCNETDGSCTCPTGFEGNLCQTASATKFVGNWRAASEVCTISGSNSQYDIAVTLSGTDQKKILITNLYDASRSVTGDINGQNTFTIASQAFGASGTISGNGSIANNQLTISYTVVAGSLNDVCNNVVFTKL